VAALAVAVLVPLVGVALTIVVAVLTTLGALIAGVLLIPLAVIVAVATGKGWRN